MNHVSAQALHDIGTALKAEPTTWHELHPEDKLSVLAAIMPDRLHGFCDPARKWIYQWWLPCGDADLALLNTLGNYAGRRDVEGVLYLSAALITDAVKGRRLAAALPMLESKVWVHETAISWPMPETEEI